MSDQPQGDDWWEASDDKWYPPEKHPEYKDPRPPPPPPEPPPPPAPGSQPYLPPPAPRPDISRRQIITFLVVIALVILAVWAVVNTCNEINRSIDESYFGGQLVETVTWVTN